MFKSNAFYRNYRFKKNLKILAKFILYVYICMYVYGSECVFHMCFMQHLPMQQQQQYVPITVGSSAMAVATDISRIVNVLSSLFPPSLREYENIHFGTINVNANFYRYSYENRKRLQLHFGWLKIRSSSKPIVKYFLHFFLFR